MKRIGVLGDIGSGKSYIAKKFGFPVFNADLEVGKIYLRNRKVFKKLNKILPNHFFQFPIKKDTVIKAILSNKSNLKKIIKVVHLEVKKKLNLFQKKNKNKKFILLDIPLMLENKIYRKSDILIFIKSDKKEILKRLKIREGYNPKLYQKFKKIQLSLDFKKKKSNYIIKNNFSKKSVKKQVKDIIKSLNNE